MGLLSLVELVSPFPLNCLFPSRGSLRRPGVMGGHVALFTAGKLFCGTALMGFLLVWSLGVAGISWI
jgi:hypothetical protein